MVSPAKFAANRGNAQHSTGPRTVAGKAVVARNAITHGFYSKHAVLPGENPEELNELRQSVLMRLNPLDALEESYVERVVINAWKLRRALQAEQQLAQTLRYSDAADYMMECTARGENLARHAAAFERAMDRALNQLEKLRKSRVLNDSVPDENIENSENKPMTPAQGSGLATSVASETKPRSAPHQEIDETNPPFIETTNAQTVAPFEEFTNLENKPTADHGCDQEMLS